MKFNVGDKVIVTHTKISQNMTLFQKATKGSVATVVRVDEETGYVNVRTEGNDMLEGGGVRFTFHESDLIPANDLGRAIYGR